MVDRIVAHSGHLTTVGILFRLALERDCEPSSRVGCVTWLSTSAASWMDQGRAHGTFARALLVVVRSVGTELPFFPVSWLWGSPQTSKGA